MSPRLPSGCFLLFLLVCQAAVAQDTAPSYPPDFPFPVKTVTAQDGCEVHFEGPNPEKTPRRTGADSMREEPDDTPLLKGVSHSGMQIDVAQLRYPLDRTGALVGEKMRIRSPALLLSAKKGMVQPSTESAELEAVHYALPGTLVHGEAATATLAEGRLQLEQATYSHCPPGRETWRLEARQLEIDTETGIARGRNLYLQLGGRRLIYLPYLRLSTNGNRSSGFLSPNLKHSSEDGLDITLPLYFNLAPNYDFTLSPRYIEKRGTLLQGEFRHLSQRSNLHLKAAHMERDRMRREENKRFLYHLDYRSTLGRQWQAEVDYTKVSDLFYLRDFGSDGLYSSRQLKLLQRGRLYRAGKNWLLEAGLSSDQAAARDALEPYRQLPWFHIAYRGGGTPFKPQYLLEMHYADFEHSSSALITGQRLYTEAGAAFPMQWRAGDLRPWVLFRHLRHRVEKGANNSAEAFSAGLEGGLRFERRSVAGRFLQTLEPRLFYVHTGYEAQDQQPDFDSERLEFTPEQLFRKTRFTGYDRIDDADRLSLVLRTRLFDTEDGREVLRASVGQIFHFRDRRVNLGEERDAREDRVSHSPLAARLEYRPDPDRHLGLEAVWDSRRGRLDGGLLNVRRSFRERGHAHLRYRFLRTAETTAGREQVETSWRLRLRQGWSIFGNWHYDFDLGQNSDTQVGVERATCCWKIRMGLQRNLESDGVQDNVFLVQLSLPKPRGI